MINKGYDKGTDEQPAQEVDKPRAGGSQAQQLLSTWSWGSAHLWACGTFTNPEASRPRTLGIFMEASSHRHGPIINSVFIPYLLPRGWGMELKVPSL